MADTIVIDWFPGHRGRDVLCAHLQKMLAAPVRAASLKVLIPALGQTWLLFLRYFGVLYVKTHACDNKKFVSHETAFYYKYFAERRKLLMTYEKAIAEMIVFDPADIITTSDVESGKPGWGWGDGGHSGPPGITGEHPNGKW